MTKLDRLLNTLFSRMKGQEGSTNAGFVFYWLDNGAQVTIVRQHGTQSLYKPKQALPPKTGVLVEGVLSPDGKGLVLDYKLCNPDGGNTSQARLLYDLDQMKIAANHTARYLICGNVPQAEYEEVEEEQY